MDEKARQLHETVGLVGLRAQATAVGFLQLCTELLRAGVLDDAAMARIKAAISKDILVGHKPLRGRDAFAESLNKRLDRLFPSEADMRVHDSSVGTSTEMQDALGISEPVEP